MTDFPDDLVERTARQLFIHRTGSASEWDDILSTWIDRDAWHAHATEFLTAILPDATVTHLWGVQTPEWTPGGDGYRCHAEDEMQARAWLIEAHDNRELIRQPIISLGWTAEPKAAQ